MICKQMVEVRIPVDGISWTEPLSRPCKLPPLQPLEIHGGYCRVHSAVEKLRRSVADKEDQQWRRQNAIVGGWLQHNQQRIYMDVLEQVARWEDSWLTRNA